MAKRRASGDGMVRKRDDGRWEGRIVVGHKKNGDPIHRYVLARTQKELTEKLHDCIEMYRDADLTEDSNMTLGEWLDKWIAEYMTGTIRESTLYGYKTYIEKYIKPALGNKQIAFITTAEIQKFYNNLKMNGRIENRNIYGQGLSDASVVRVHYMLHEAMDMAVKEHLISKNPTNGTTVPKIVKKEMQVLTDEQLEIFMKLIDSEERWRDFFYTELTTGLRRGEICGLKWTDFDEVEGKLNINRSIDVKNGVITEGETKTGQGKRSFYLPVSTANVLKERKKNAKGEGTLRKRADGRWEARVVIGYNEKGLPITKNVTAMEKGKCLEKLEQLKEQCGVQLTGKVKAEMAFGDWMDFWYQQYEKQRVRPTTQAHYENLIYNHVVTDIGKIPLNKLTQNDLQQFYSKLKISGRKIRTEVYGNGLSDRMVRGCHAICRKGLQKAVDDGLIRMNPAVGCKLPPKM